MTTNLTVKYSDTDPAPEENVYRGTLLGRMDRRFLNNRAAKIILGILFGAMLVVPAMQSVRKIKEIDTSLWREGGTRHKTALGRWIPTAELLTQPPPIDSPYGSGQWFPTPPLMLISLVPLTKLGYTGAAIARAALKIVGIFLAMAFVIKGLGRESFSVPVGVMVAAAIFSVRPLISDLQHANLNIFMMVWLALAWAMYVRGHDFWAGLFLALAIVTKLTPALALIYFAYKRAWRVCIGAAIGLVLFFVVLPGLYLGFDRNTEYLHSWYEMLVAPFLIQRYAATEIANQSLYGVALRLLSNAHLLTVEQMPVKDALAAGMEDMARPVTTMGALLRPAISLSILAALGWLCRSKVASRRDPRLLLEFGLVLLAMLLLSERTWKHHATTLPIVFLGVWYALTCFPLSDRFRAGYVIGLGVQLFLLVLSTEGLLPERVADHLLDGGVFCWGLVLCFIQTGVLLRMLNRPEKVITNTPIAPPTVSNMHRRIR